MAFAISLSQLLLALIFAIAGIAKLADPRGTREESEAFGVPSGLARVVARVLPPVELAIAAALIPAATAAWAALAAAALLLVFSSAILRVIRAGSAPDCNCFGGLTQTEVGRGTAVRDLILAALAGLIFVGSSGGAASAFHWVLVPAAGDRVPVVLMVVMIAGLTLFCWRLLQQNGRLLLELDRLGSESRSGGVASLPPLERGAPAPQFAGRDLRGAPVSLESLLAPGLPVALFFTNPGCGACELVLAAVGQAQNERGDELTLAVISGGSISRIEEKAVEYGLDRVVPQEGDALFDAYRVHGFPAIVEIDPRGAISKPAALGPAAVREVVLGEPAAVQIEPVLR